MRRRVGPLLAPLRGAAREVVAARGGATCASSCLGKRPLCTSSGRIFDTTSALGPVPDKSFTDFILDSTDAHGDRPALVDGASGRTLTFAELRPTVSALASALYHEHGLRKRDVSAVLLPNCPDYFVIFHGIASLGAVLSTLNPLYTAGEIAEQLTDSNSKMVFTVSALLPVAMEAAQQTGATIERIVVLDATEADTSGAVPVTPYSALIEQGRAAPPAPPTSIAPSDLVVLPYSSGTSGKPKGVELTHSNVVTNLVQLEASLDLSPDDKVLGLLPFFHIYGMIVVLNAAIERGATVVTMPRFEPAHFLQVVKEHEMTVMHVAPPLMVFLAKAPPVADILPLSRLREIVCAAAPLGPELAAAVKARLHQSTSLIIRQGYGMTELSPASHVAPKGIAADKLGSVGALLPGQRCKIVDTETGALCAVGEEGEIVLQGPNVMRGYLNRPEATAECLDAEGWLRTGDVGYVDSDGLYYIVDRVKELIKTKGFQVAPAELEALLCGWEKVADAAVIGIPDERSGEVPKAFVVRQPGHESLTADEVKDYVRPQVAPYKQIEIVEFIDAVPKSLAGKILRRMLRAQ